MKKIIKLVSISISMTFVFSCSTSVKMKLLKPSEVNLGKRKRIAVLNFKTTNNIDGYNRSIGNNISDKIVAKLLAEEGFIVVERERISALVSEQELLSASGASKLNSLLGVEALITGSLNCDIHDSKNISKKEYKFSDGVLVRYSAGQIIRNASFYLTYKVIDAQTGQILATKQNKKSFDYSTSEFPLKGYDRTLIRPNTNSSVYNDPFNKDKKTSTNNDPFNKKPAVITEDPFNKPTSTPKIYPDSYYYEQFTFSRFEDQDDTLTSHFSIIDKGLDSLSNKIVYQITPHYEESSIQIKGGNASIMNDASNYVNKGDWNQAITIWNSVISNTSANDSFAINDKASAYYNVGAYYELLSELDNSLAYYKKAYEIYNDSFYNDSINRVYERKNEIALLEQQGLTDSISPAIKKIDAPSASNNYFNSAAKYHSQGNLEMAISEYNKEIQYNPNNFNAYHNLGVIYHTKQDWEKAEYYYSQSIKLDPNDPNKHYNLALIYKVRGKTSESSYEMKRACILGLNQACN